MKKSVFLSAVLLLSISSFGATIVNNFTGFNNGWFPFGDGSSSTQTYGEVFTVPDGVSFLNSFSFYTGGPIDQGNIVAGAYIGTWHTNKIGTVVYSSQPIDYDNAGNEQLTVNTGGLPVTPGQQYIMFLSTTLFHGQSSGSTYMSDGDPNGALNGFAFYNNGSNWGVLLGTPWQGVGLSPDLAVNLNFDTTPEPSTLVMLGSGILASFGLLRRKLF